MSGAAGLFSPVASALSVAILRGLWEGGLIGLVTAVTLAAMSRRSAQARYSVACLGLAAMLVAFAATFTVALGDTVKVDLSTAAAGPGRLLPISIGGSASHLGTPWLAIAWLAGASVAAVSNVVQLGAVRRLTASAHFDIRDGWRDAFETVSRDLHLDRLARLGHSAAVEVPTVIGWLAPIVLVPFAPCTALSGEELCAIIAHELAHIRRRDYLVNAVQRVVEVVLFFHPITWWLSRRIRVEREYCCDDVAVQYTNSALGYARALSRLETLRTQRPGYAMGADGGALMNRIARMVGAKPKRRQVSIIGGVLGALVVAMVGIAFVVGNCSVAFAGGGSATPGPNAIVAAAHGALDQLVANGTIDQSQANQVEQAVIAGRVDPGALVSSGLVTEAQMQAISDALGQVKRSFAPTTTEPTPRCDAVAAKLAQAAQAGKLAQAQADQQVADCTAGTTTGNAKTAGGTPTR